MTPRRPYLLRAMYAWMVDNELTPYLLVDAEVAGVDVPRAYVEDGKIVLNLAPAATDRLDMSGDAVEFMARFGGQSQRIQVPGTAILAIYASETGQGMMFGPDDGGDDTPPPAGPDDGGQSGEKRPALRVVK